MPRDEPSLYWNTIRIGTRITVQDSAYHSEGAQGSIQSYDEILDRYYVMLDNATGQMLFGKSVLLQNIGVTLRSAMAIEFGAYVATLLRYKTCSSSRCYKVRDFDAVSPWLSFIGVVPSWLVPARPKSACVSRWQNQLRYGIFLLLCLDKNVIV